jgi:tetratricopeptide (TPR) repeat protein
MKPALLAYCVLVASQTAFGQDPHVYLINNSGEAALTGFRVKGKKGIITSLHGVVDYKTLIAKPAIGKVYNHGLEVREVNVDHDLALISSQELDSEEAVGLEAAREPDWRTLRRVYVIGYPEGITFEELVTPLEVRRDKPCVELENVVHENDLPSLRKRKSPKLDIQVLCLSGFLRPGHSGAPLVNENWKVVAMGCGGIEPLGVGWAIPLGEHLTDPKFWKPAKGHTDLDRLRQLGRAGLFAVSSKPASIEAKLDQIQKDIVPHLKKFADELKALRLELAEVRAINKRLGNVQLRSIRDFNEISGRLGTLADIERDNQNVQKVAARVIARIKKINEEATSGEYPPEVRSFMERAEADAELANGNYRRVLEIQSKLKIDRLQKELTAIDQEKKAKRGELAHAHRQRGRAYRGLKEWKSAAEEYEGALELDATDFLSALMASTCWMALNDWKKVEEIVDMRLKDGSKFADGYLMMARRGVLDVDQLDQFTAAAGYTGLRFQRALLALRKQSKLPPSLGIEDCTYCVDYFESVLTSQNITPRLREATLGNLINPYWARAELRQKEAKPKAGDLALADYTKSIENGELYMAVIGKAQPTAQAPFSDHLAHESVVADARVKRGQIYVQREKLKMAFDDFDKAYTTLNKLVFTLKLPAYQHSDYHADVATAVMLRAAVRMDDDDPKSSDAAATDCARAAEIFEGLVHAGHKQYIPFARQAREFEDKLKKRRDP